MKTILSLLVLIMTLGVQGQTPYIDKVKILPNSTYTVPAVMFQSTASAGLPLVIFFHGSGEAGTTGTALWNAGLPAALKAGFLPPYPVVIVAPQRSSYSADPAWIKPIIADMYARFKIDTNRIYLTGLSAGGWPTYGGQFNIDSLFARKIAAIVPLSAATQDITKTNIKWAFAPTWAIVGGNDISYKEQNQDMVNRINAVKPGLAKIDIRAGIGHGGWTEIYNGTWKDAAGANIWDWLKGKSLVPVVVTPVPLPTPTPLPVKTIESELTFKNYVSDSCSFKITFYTDGTSVKTKN